ncbi:hypothetical protein MMC11_008919 [Xylographa trunciseda]|nr:hypothetical protein [Xylographa trunciseda]
MPSLLGKKFPAPVAEPMWPFYTAGQYSSAVLDSIDTYVSFPQTEVVSRAERLANIRRRTGVVIMYGVNSLATALMNSEEFKNDPRNPAAKTQKPADKRS